MSQDLMMIGMDLVIIFTAIKLFTMRYSGMDDIDRPVCSIVLGEMVFTFGIASIVIFSRIAESFGGVLGVAAYPLASLFDGSGNYLMFMAARDVLIAFLVMAYFGSTWILTLYALSAAINLFSGASIGLGLLESWDAGRILVMASIEGCKLAIIAGFRFDDMLLWFVPDKARN